MIKIRVVAVGKNKDAWVSDGIEHFTKLLGRWAQISIETVTPKIPSSLSPAEIKKREAAALEPKLSGGFTVALFDAGKRYDSRRFASRLEKWQRQSGGTITFVIGGPYGLDDGIINDADEVLSLSPLTFSHQIVRLVLLEQLYRAFSILHGTDYHK